ncbi:hypothetical protein B0J13DRAFT_150410 [Dactylonectria estremocensis]|uniref:Myb-like domain-containing protein n=1 Tax=Dactylonectria estremocensis TaxID=1079267 RepID=A0A9P9DS71_9HYPO|nr:hypothetical protein B0J13DRAFT_150410 [Dactylonectria estremocensis]
MMSLKIKPYDPFRQKRRADRKQHVKPHEWTEQSASGSPDEDRLRRNTPRRTADDDDCSPIEESDIIRDLFASFPSEEECLSLCFPATDVSSACTPASACSLGYQTGVFVWRGQDSDIGVEDDRLDSISDMANFTTSDATPKAVLNGGDLCRSHDLSAPISGNTCAQGASALELNNEILDQSAEKFGILASAATQARLSCKEGDDHSTNGHETAVGIDSDEALPWSDTKASSPKRSLQDSDGPVKRLRSSDLHTDSSPRLESDHLTPTLTPGVNRSTDQPSQVTAAVSQPFRPGYPLSQRPELMLMPTGQADSVRLGLLEIQRIVSSLLGQLGPGQDPQNISSERSVQSNTASSDGAEMLASDDSDDDSRDDIDRDSAGTSELGTGSPKSTRHKSTQRCKWTKEEEDLLRRLKNIGTLSDIQIARKLDRSENGVKQHWYIMSRATQG